MGVEHLVVLGSCCFQAEDGIRDLVRSRGLGDVYKRQLQLPAGKATPAPPVGTALGPQGVNIMAFVKEYNALSLIHI